jgi:hypothetical protein
VAAAALEMPGHRKSHDAKADPGYAEYHLDAPILVVANDERLENSSNATRILA